MATSKCLTRLHQRHVALLCPAWDEKFHLINQLHKKESVGWSINLIPIGWNQMLHETQRLAGSFDEVQWSWEENSGGP